MNPSQLYYDHHYQQGRHLPQSWLEPPYRPPLEQEIKWMILDFDNYCIDRWNRFWHRPGPDYQGHIRGWRPLKEAVKNGYSGFRLRKRGKEYWMSVRALRRRLRRVARN